MQDDFFINISQKCDDPQKYSNLMMPSWLPSWWHRDDGILVELSDIRYILEHHTKNFHCDALQLLKSQLSR